MQFKDYYEMLSVPRDADAAQIRRAFRKLARRYHPDVSKEPDAAARMSELNEAYAVLSDPERRAAYDSIGSRRAGEAFTPPPDWRSGFGSGEPSFDETRAGEFSDFFAELFGRMGTSPWGAAAHGTRARPARGEDHHARVVLELSDVFGGATRQVTLHEPQRADGGRIVFQDRTLEVRIPAGVRPGQRIRLAGQGGAGVGGIPAGDLLLEVAIAPHPRFRVEGSNLIAELPVAPWEAGLGAVVPVTMPDAAVLKVRVPAGAQSGRRLVVRGRGLPSAEPGDLELIVRVVLPDAADPRARELYELMAKRLSDFDPRAPEHASASQSS